MGLHHVLGQVAQAGLDQGLSAKRIHQDLVRDRGFAGSYQSVNANYYNPSYGVANASVALDRAGYEIALYVKNLFDDKTIIQSPEINTVVEGYTVHPRTIGVTLKAGF